MKTALLQRVLEDSEYWSSMSTTMTLVTMVILTMMIMMMTVTFPAAPANVACTALIRAADLTSAEDTVWWWWFYSWVN